MRGNSSHRKLKRSAAPGVDGVTWRDYEEGLDERMAALWDAIQSYETKSEDPRNLKRLGLFRAEVCRAWLRSLRRRSQRSRMTLGPVPALRWAIHPESPRLSSASQSTVRVMTQGRSRMR